MSEQQIGDASAMGYAVIKASPFEVGLTHLGKGVRTWYASVFAGRLPKLDHAIIQEAIEAHERMLYGA